MTIPSRSWNDANRQYLGAALAELRLLLEVYTARRNDTPAPPEAAFDDVRQASAAAAAELASPSALDQVTTAFELSGFERRLLLLCAAVELDGDFARVCASASGEGNAGVTFALALAALPGAHWDALAPNGPLRYWRLIEIGPGPALTASPLRIDERILHFLTGVDGLDDRLPLSPPPALSPAPLGDADRALAEEMAQAWASDRCPILQIYGPDRDRNLTIVQAACQLLELECELLPASTLSGSAKEVQTLGRLWNREILLGDRALLIEWEEWAGTDHSLERMMSLLLAELSGPVAVSSRERISFGLTPMVLMEAPPATDASQMETWRHALGDGFPPLEAEVERVAAQFRLGVTAIAAAAAIVDTASLADTTAPPTPEESGIALWEFCRRQTRSRLDTLADRVDTSPAWNDLILPDQQKFMLREIVAQVRHRSRVYGQWGFAAGGSRNLGITALFAGPSGTGKTFAAEILASELRLDLYRVDLSGVVSKYIGETEKNLRCIFDAAEAGGAILLFDEADALFGKRSEVKDSHDRYANIEVSYLLQRMEAYRGLAILTTNIKQALDSAFLRRLRFVVDFPFPGPIERAAIWTRSIPAAAPTAGIDVQKLARLSMTGGNIRNICLSAAFVAAADGGVIRMEHLLHGARAESMKLDRALNDAETRDWC